MVGVHPDFQGRGIGKQLTKNCIEYAKQTGEQILALHTSEFMDSARYIYEKIGFKKVKELNPIFGKIYWLYQMNLKQQISKIMKITYGSTIGNTLRKQKYNNQDFVLVKIIGDRRVLLVVDGCGSNSEVGVQLGLKYLVREITENPENWRENLATKLRNYSKEESINYPEEYTDFVRNYLLYTVIGCVVHQGKASVFSCGDGVKIINGQIDIINQDNQPKYVNNALLGKEPEEFTFTEIELDQTPILIGSKGVEEIIDGMASGEITEYPTIMALMNDEKMYDNPITLSRFLQKYRRLGILRDDCGLIIIKP